MGDVKRQVYTAAGEEIIRQKGKEYGVNVDAKGIMGGLIGGAQLLNKHAPGLAQSAGNAISGHVQKQMQDPEV